MKSRYTVARRFLLFWCAFIGLGALWGGIAMLIKPDGSILSMQNMLPYFQVLPFSDVLFQDYVFSGIMLIIVNGITNIISFILILKNKKIGVVLGMIFGITLMLWIIIQFIIFPVNILSTIYFIFGVLQFITGFITLVFYLQEHFIFDETNYEVSKDSKSVVIYFSRMNYTKKIAYEEAIRTQSEIIELQTLEPTKGTGGFWWCGRFAIKRQAMPTLPVEISKYSNVIICTPIWVLRICSPVRDFINKYQKELAEKNVTIIYNSFNKLKPQNIIKEVEDKIGSVKVQSYITHYGKTTKSSN